jgi:uncharacterized protein (TIGR02302 family)
MSGAAPAPPLASLLARKRRGAAAVLWIERLAPALAPAAALVLGFCALAFSGALAALPPLAVLLVLMLCTGGAILAAALRLRRLARPARAEIDRRLERREPHQPLITLADRPAFAGAEAVWQAHRERALARVPHLSAGAPRLERRTAALLAGAALLALAAGISAGPMAPALLWRALTPDVAGPPAAPATLQAWIVLPEAMHLPPIFLSPGQPMAVAAPPGAHLTLSLSGGGRPSLLYAGARHRFDRLAPGRFQADLTLTRSGTLEVRAGGARLAAWPVTVAPPRAPSIILDGPATIAERTLRVPWHASDEYGLAGIAAELRLQARPAAAPMVIPLPLPGVPRTASGAGLPDLTANPWAGLPVALRYRARGSAGLSGASTSVAVTLPERVFVNPIARALIAIRRGLALDPATTVSAARALDHLSDRVPPAFPLSQWLNLRAIAALLAERPGGADAAIGRLWQLAMQIEDAGVADAKQRLTDARNALSEALAAPPSPAQQQIIAQLTQALRQAMQHYLQAMNRQAEQSGVAPPEQQGGRSMDADQLQQMARDMANAARAGRTAEAQQRLAELGAILDNLRQSHRTAGGGQSARAPDPALLKLLQDQSALRARAGQRLSDDADPRTSTAPERDPDEAAGQPDPGTQRNEDAQAQAALRAQLGQLAEKLGDQTGAVPDGLAKADSAMRDAQAALTQGDDKAAQAAQLRALQGLRGAGGQTASGTGSGPTPGPGTDPLGRAIGEGGNAPDDANVNLPTQGDAARSRALRDELRRRAADRTRPPAELEYLQRLLEY